jgi:hypothetical protein
MEDYFDSDKQRLREGFYIGKNSNSLLVYLSREEDKWMLEMPGIGKKYSFNPKTLAGEIKRVYDIDELLKTTRDDLILSKHLCGYYIDDGEFPEVPEGVISAQDRFLFVQTRISKN